MGAKKEIYITESEGFSKEALRILESFANVHMPLKGLKGIGKVHCDCLIVRLKYYISEGILKRFGWLKAIATPTTGLNHIDLKAAKELGIEVLSLKGEREFLSTIYATAEHTMALILALVRKIPAAYDSVKKGRWDRDLFKGTELRGRTLGIIGFGRLGKMVAHYASSFGMEVLYNDIYPQPHPANTRAVSLNTLLRRSDIVSLHIPYNEKTRNLFNTRIFNRMKRGAYLINTSRGEVIKEKDILKALKTRRLGGAALDVLSGEQQNGFAAKNRLINYAKKNPNVIITPHTGGATYESMEKTEIYLANKIKLYFKNRSKRKKI